MVIASAVVVAPVGTVPRLQPAGGGAAALGQTPASTDLVDGVTQDAAEALAADLAAIREANDWTNEQLAAYETAENALDTVTGRLSADYHAFVGSALAGAPTKPPTVYVKGRAPADIRAIATALGVVLVEDQPYSLDELDARLGAVHEAMLSAGFDNLVVSADIQRAGAITLVVTLPSGASLDPVLNGIAPDIADDITVIIEADSVVEPQGAFGGMKLQDGGVFLCTSGWTVRKLSNGVRGVTGAGHCAGIDQINHPGHAVHGAVRQLAHVGQWGDVDWYTTAEAEADLFYADEFGNIRNVGAVEPRANIAINESICVYGRQSNKRDCSLEVENPNVFCGSPQKLVQMNGFVTQGGDSGGGWSMGVTAYGGHYGFCFNKSSFSVADLFDEALGVAVAVN